MMLAALSLGIAQSANAQFIRTVAGNGGDTLSGDGGNAFRASIATCTGVAVDSRGNMYITINTLHTIKKVTRNGIISTYAGTGYPGFSGDGGPASAARINSPYGIIVDRDDNIFFADGGNLRVRKIDTSGTITTIAGVGGFGYYSGDGGAAVASKTGALNLSFDYSGNLLIADGNSRIRKVNTSGIISTVAGSGAVGISSTTGPATSYPIEGPTGVTADSRGNIYFSEAINNMLKKVNASGIISLYGGSSSGSAGSSGDGGRVSSARFNRTNSLRVDSVNNIFVVDMGNHRIRKIDTNNMIRLAWGSTSGFAGDGGPATGAKFSSPTDLTIDKWGNIYICDYSNKRVRQIYKIDTFRITVSPDDTICGGAAAIFRAGINKPYYNSRIQWYVNGTPAGGDSLIFTATSIRTGDLVTCRVLDTNYSGGILLAVSDTIRMTTSPVVVPHTHITVSRDTLCARDTITLTASAINGGPTPRFTWFRFSTPIGTGQTIVYNPTFGDIITVILTSSEICPSPDTAMDSRRLYITDSYEPLVTIDAYPGTTINHWGDIVHLYTESTFGGSAPTYQWYRSGTPIPGATNQTLDVEVYANDTLYCVMHSNHVCVVPSVDTSNTIYISTGRLAVEQPLGTLGGLKTYPNPSSNTFNIEGIDERFNGKGLDINVTDVTGRSIYHAYQVYYNVPLRISLPDDVITGIYHLTIVAEGERKSIPVTIIR